MADKKNKASKSNPLSRELLDTVLKPKFDGAKFSERPEDSFKQLMDWVIENFSSELKKKDNLVNLIHNRISIDENFLLFAKDNKIEVECLYRDSVISWQEKDFEKFFTQGVFRIYSKKTEFIMSALFHKGCNNEDEVSFFVLCDSSNYEEYLNIRNGYDSWLKVRDRDSQEVYVVDGEGIPYTNDNKWEDLFLPDKIKSEIKNIVEVFLSSKDWYLENNIPWKRGIFLHGVQGNGKTSIIKTIISQYDFKPVTICPGGGTEQVMDAFKYAESQSPSLLYLEDLDSLISSGQVEKSSFLNLMDGVASKNGLLIIATANFPELLPANITDRPSRFDRKFEIPLPDKVLTLKYLKKCFGKKIADSSLSKIADKCFKQKLSYAYLEELYVSTMFSIISKNKKVPGVSDIDNALANIISERILSDDNKLNINKYIEDEVS